jgi:phospholipid transport system substrate-binding protein
MGKGPCGLHSWPGSAWRGPFGSWLLSGLPGRGTAAADAGAGAFLSDLSVKAIDQLTVAGLSREEKERRFRKLMVQGFDIPAIGRFVLGRYWRRADRPDRDAFLNIFEDMIVFRFLPLFEDQAGDKLHVGVVRPFGNNTHLFNVSSELVRKKGEPVQIDWRIRKEGDQYKILDVIAEGVSIAVTLRAEYGSVLKQNGGNVAELTQTLRKKLATL